MFGVMTSYLNCINIKEHTPTQSLKSSKRSQHQIRSSKREGASNKMFVNLQCTTILIKKEHLYACNYTKYSKCYDKCS